MPEIIDMLKSAAQIDARLAQAKQVTLVPSGGVPVKPVAPTYAVYKMADGQRGARASAVGLTREAAEQYVADRPANQYEIEAE